MNTEEVFEKVKAVIVEQLGVSEATVEMEASFIDDLGADSLDIVELIMALEEELMEKEEVKEVEVNKGEKNYNDLTDEEVEAVKELKASA